MRYHAANTARERAMGENIALFAASGVPVPEAQPLDSEDMDKNLPACLTPNNSCAVNDWQNLIGGELAAAEALCGNASARFAESNCPRMALTAAGVQLMPFRELLPTPEQGKDTLATLREADLAATEQQHPQVSSNQEAQQ